LHQVTSHPLIFGSGLLANSAIIVEKANKDRITLEDVEKAYEKVKEGVYA
jgi:DNA helicase TIP49 (TBP-interacting protein)